MTPITLNVPDYVWYIFSGGVFAVLLFIGYQWRALKEVCAEMPKMRRALDLISQLLLTKEWTKDHIYVSAKSPLGLTSAGRDMLKASDFEKFFDANKKAFFSYIDSKKPESEADVEAATSRADALSGY